VQTSQRAQQAEAPLYLRPSRQRLRSSADSLFVRDVRLPTVGRRAFSVAGASLWNYDFAYIKAKTQKYTYFVRPTSVLPFNCTDCANCVFFALLKIAVRLSCHVKKITMTD